MTISQEPRNGIGINVYQINHSMKLFHDFFKLTIQDGNHPPLLKIAKNMKTIISHKLLNGF